MNHKYHLGLEGTFIGTYAAPKLILSDLHVLTHLILPEKNELEVIIAPLCS